MKERKYRINRKWKRRGIYRFEWTGFKENQIVTCDVENAHMDIGKRDKSGFEKLQINL